MKIKSKFNIGDTVYFKNGTKPYVVDEITVWKRDKQLVFSYWIRSSFSERSVDEEYLSIKSPKKKGNLGFERKLRKK